MSSLTLLDARRRASDARARRTTRSVLGHRRRHGPDRRHPAPPPCGCSPVETACDARRHRARHRPRRRPGPDGVAATTATATRWPGSTAWPAAARSGARCSCAATTPAATSSRARAPPPACRSPERARSAAAVGRPAGCCDRPPCAPSTSSATARRPAHERGRLESLPSFFHPLDGVPELEPPLRAARLPAVPVRRALRRARTPCARRSSALSGAGARLVPRRAQALRAADAGLLSFPMPGWTLALDMPGRRSPALGAAARRARRARGRRRRPRLPGQGLPAAARPARGHVPASWSAGARSATSSTRTG